MLRSTFRFQYAAGRVLAGNFPLRPLCALEAPGWPPQHADLLPCEPLVTKRNGLSGPCFSAFFSSTTGQTEDDNSKRDASVPISPSLISAASPPELEDDVFEYHGPFSNAVKRVKGLSVGSLGATVIGAPLLVSLHADASMTLGAKAGIVFSLCGFGAFTTGLLHWFAAPYVHHLKYSRTTGIIDVETMTFFLQPRVARFHVSEVGPTESLSPVSTFQARGVTYYVDGDNFQDKELLAKLAPPTEEDPSGDKSGPVSAAE
mmetsp:Transcript_4492/g.12560  ORF Transcript_4492/g.12560 Transcript_4492/m.12560 type:complete len:260 (+) Transcript_4492:80-859(+)|eukprot:CAMPEP_0117670236 /NCGR_PEP_ID=MMETSP0804-20121206/12625_1 /TAXON_ID=1074897 /ORGANISM="Tetraselmis astigmatica, Strain CCMP880" /LENGTH=259 /DNA_ID=CAMNT_0005478481 /DNA_START=24 /DNA_END=803 /DNA_ORIENTATION=-